jgi:hypothetical protein
VRTRARTHLLSRSIVVTNSGEQCNMIYFASTGAMMIGLVYQI